MYSIQRTVYGFRLVFGGFIQAEEMAKWVEESKKDLIGAPQEFGVFVDMRTLKPLPSDSQISMQEGQKLYKQKGMVRSVVILDNAITTAQFQRIAKETGIYEWERYIDSSKVTDWEKIGLDWIKNKVDPDK